VKFQHVAAPLQLPALALLLINRATNTKLKSLASHVPMQQMQRGWDGGPSPRLEYIGVALLKSEMTQLEQQQPRPGILRSLNLRQMV